MVGDADHHAPDPHFSKSLKQRTYGKLKFSVSSALAKVLGFAMMRVMRILAAFLCAVAIISGARSESLSSADREALLGTLEKLHETASSHVNARFRMAQAAYREAITTDQAVIDFYLKCTEKINFTDQKKKPSEFRDWKHAEKERMGDPAFKMALRCQLQWLILTLRACSENVTVESLAPDAQDIMDGIFNNADQLKTQNKTLNQAVTSTVFAKAYEVVGPEKKKWPLSPFDLDSVYKQVIFPAYRTPSKLGQLRATWIKRIKQEEIKFETWQDPGKSDKKVGTASTRSPEYQKFIEDVIPELLWEMEMDLFSNGDESGAAKRMLAHIEKYINHKSSRAWGDAFKNQLLPKPVVPPVTGATPAP